ncbi:MAG TPA: type II toxin-antitoxin system VapC family toxin [Xanthobacteraceae bacterium]|nr:type II toxin-antitoxin system VapC family toxin [Xanthobacteraceae bacterium]
MIGLDTNVLLRLFVEEDDPQQSERARAFVERVGSDQPCLVNAVVLAEFVWALAKPLRRPKGEIVKYLEALLDADDLEIERRSAARAAVEAYRVGKADFADYLLAGINAELGCASTASFDAEALKSKLFSPVP